MTIENYTASVSEKQKDAFTKLFNVVKANIPEGFIEMMQYKMPSFVVPLSNYPDGYHCAKDTPLPFVSIAAQKNFIALYHMGVYVCKPLYDWFTAEYATHSKYKLDMGKSCMRFKKYDDIPYELIARLMQKMSVEEWIGLYEKTYKPNKK